MSLSVKLAMAPGICVCRGGGFVEQEARARSECSAHTREQVWRHTLASWGTGQTSTWARFQRHCPGSHPKCQEETSRESARIRTTDNSPSSQAWRGEGLWWRQSASKPLQKRKGRWLQSARHSSHAQKRREGKSRSCRQQKMLEKAGSHRDTAPRKASRRRTNWRKQPALAKMTAKPRGPRHQQTGPRPKTALKGVPEQSSTNRENSAFAGPHSKVIFRKKEKHYRIL